MTDWGPWSGILVRHPRDAFRDHDTIARQAADLHFTAPPDPALACAQFDAFAELLRLSGAPVHEHRSSDPALTLDSIYVRDAAVTSARGVVLCRMGKPRRAAEPDALGLSLASLGLPILGTITPPGRLEGGDVTWLGPRLAAVGLGYRTNADGARQLRTLLGDAIDALIEVPLPHHRGPSDVFHLMSILSPVDRDLAVVYSPLMPVPFRDRLLDLGFRLVEVGHDEFESMGANVLAIAPRRCVMVEGNPRTRAALERAGADVRVYDGSEISLKGGGGPTCLTRPLAM